jgi:hypothetical protein
MKYKERIRKIDEERHFNTEKWNGWMDEAVAMIP